MRFLLLVVVACSSPAVAPTKQPAPPAKPERSVPAPAPAPTSKNPSGCPAAEPNINGLCTEPGLECTYGASRCPPVYICTTQRRFEAQFRGCPR